MRPIGCEGCTLWRICVIYLGITDGNFFLKELE